MKMARVWAVTLALATVAVPAFAQGQGRPGGFRGGFGGGRGGFDGPGSLLRMPEVQKELKLDQTQVELLQQLNKEIDDKRGAMFQGFRDLTDEQRREKFQSLRPQMEKLQEDQEKKVAEILDPKQSARLKQLSLQRAGANALGRPEVQTELKFTADQKAKFMAAQQAAGESFRALFQQGGERPSPEKFAEIRKANDAKLLAVLTDAQKKQFEAMQGAPFTFPAPQFGRGNRQRNNNN